MKRSMCWMSLERGAREKAVTPVTHDTSASGAAAVGCGPPTPTYYYNYYAYYYAYYLLWCHGWDQTQ